MKLRDQLIHAGLTLLTITIQLVVFAAFAFFILYVTSCSKEGEKEEQPQSSEQAVHKEKKDEKKTEVKNCTVIDTEEGAVVSCPDGSTVLIKDGEKGEEGEPAPLCQIEVVQTCE